MSLPSPYAYGTLGFSSTTYPDQETVVESSLGGGVGLSKRLWIDGSSGSFKMAPTLGFHSPQIGVGALLVEVPGFELDATAHVTFASEDGKPIEQIEPGLISVTKVGRARLDGSFYLDVNPGETTTIGLRVPASIGFQITEHVHASINSGVTISNLADTRGTTSIPAGLTLGWSDRIGTAGQSVGVSPSISFPDLLMPGTDQVFRPGKAVISVTFAISGKL